MVKDIEIQKAALKVTAKHAPQMDALNERIIVWMVMTKEWELLLVNVFSTLGRWMQPPNSTKEIIISITSLLSYGLVFL